MRSLIIVLFIAILLGAESRFIGGAGNRIPGKIRAFWLLTNIRIL